jgi:hypothetical protein
LAVIKKELRANLKIIDLAALGRVRIKKANAPLVAGFINCCQLMQKAICQKNQIRLS